MPGMSANVLANLRAFGIQVEHITNEHKIEKHRFIDERYNQHLLRYDIGESNLIAPLDINKINFNTSYDAVVISDYNKGFLREAECNELCTRFKEVPIFVDTKKNKLTCYHNCVIKINEKEYKNIIQKPNLAEFVVTLGDRGALYNNAFYQTDPVEVFDVCGAGDVFLSALVYGFLKTHSMEESVKLANKCASLSVSKMGTYVLTKEDVDDLCV
jgi:D-beta-D-heptose 7-phosphate kinase/D-beta-D-heptose 1-phosphate adenosyltransferase